MATTMSAGPSSSYMLPNIDAITAAPPRKAVELADHADHIYDSKQPAKPQPTNPSYSTNSPSLTGHKQTPIQRTLSGRILLSASARAADRSTAKAASKPLTKAAVDAQQKKKKRLSKILKNWIHSRNELPVADAVDQANTEIANFGALIADIILQHPTRTASAKSICREIIKKYDWYNRNPHQGWQAAISQELAQNPCFAPVSVRRRGRATERIKWQISNTQYDDILRRFQSSGQPHHMSNTLTLPGESQPLVRSSPLPAPRPGRASRIRRLRRRLNPLANDSSFGHHEVSEPPLTSGPFELSVDPPPPPIELPTTSPTLSSPPPTLSSPPPTLSSPPPISQPTSQPVSQPTSQLTIQTSQFPYSWSIGDSNNSPNWEHQVAFVGNNDEDSALVTQAGPSNQPFPTNFNLLEGAQDSKSLGQLSDYFYDGKGKGKGPANRFVEAKPDVDLASIIKSFAESYRQTAQNQQKADSSSQNVQQPPETSSQEKQHSATGNARNGSRDDADNHSQGEDDDDGNSRKRKRFREPERGPTRRSFACVYHKFDPQTYGVNDRRYLVCAGTSFRYISELVRHLTRNHDEHVCGKCLQKFENERGKDDHVRSCTARLRQSQESMWGMLWRARFPDSAVPSNPYLETLSSSPEKSPEGLPDLPESTSSTLVGDWSASRQHTSSSDVLHGSRQQNLTAINVTNPFKLSIQLLENRVDSLEKRLPLVEKTTTLLQSMLSTDTVQHKSCAQDTSDKENVSDISTNVQDSETTAWLDLSREKWPWKKAATLDEQLRSVLPARRSRLSVSNRSKTSPSSIGNSETIGEFSTSTALGTGNSQFSGSALDIGTILPDNAYDGSEFLTAELHMDHNFNGSEFSWHPGDDLSDNSGLDLHQSLLKMAAPAMRTLGQHPSMTCAVHGAFCKSPTGCLVAPSTEPQDQSQSDEDAFDIIMGNSKDSGIESDFTIGADISNIWAAELQVANDSNTTAGTM